LNLFKLRVAEVEYRNVFVEFPRFCGQMIWLSLRVFREVSKYHFASEYATWAILEHVFCWTG